MAVQYQPQPAQEPKASKGYGLTRQAKNRLTIIIFLLPAVVIFSVFIIYPIFRSAYFSSR
jgi:heme/copper-type cytochrome/quinol oxidase subunit 3